ncbi:type II toxin-antitoxin system ParD family antitoxin (plasmid) [Tistrella bauzanensis]|uniref:ribbon-helix-helix domain-containing protein n=1 Tax=Tistrella TaxID=171436 RepID=UPI0031F694C0
MAPVEKITIALPPDLAASVRHAVEVGDYGSASDAVCETVREWRDRRDLLGYTVDDLRGLVQEGIDSGPAIAFDARDIKQAARRRLAASRG